MSEYLDSENLSEYLLVLVITNLFNVVQMKKFIHSFTHSLIQN